MKTKEEILIKFKTNYYKFSLSRILFLISMSIFLLIPFSLPLWMIICIFFLIINKSIPPILLREFSDAEIGLYMTILFFCSYTLGFLSAISLDCLIIKFFKRNPGYDKIVTEAEIHNSILKHI